MHILFLEQKQPAQSIVELIDSLPIDLKLEVSTDNALFDAEMIKWDAERNTDHSGCVVYDPEKKTFVKQSPCNDMVRIHKKVFLD